MHHPWDNPPHATIHTRLPFFPECEVIYEDGKDSKQLYDGCEKNPEHTDFIALNELTEEDLPLEWRGKDYMDLIRYWGNRTVRVVAKYTSNTRPDTYPNSQKPYPYAELKGSRRAYRCGTGYMYHVSEQPIDGPCPCKFCRNSGKPENQYMKVWVCTAAHLVFDLEEAYNALIECFYDSDDRSKVIELYGCHIEGVFQEDDRCHHDRCLIQWATHDQDAMKTLIEMEKEYKFERKHQRYWKVLEKLRELSETEMTNEEIKLKFESINMGDAFEDMKRMEIGKFFIISHPHGCPKHVTFGNVAYSTVKSDPKYPRGKSHRLDRVLRLEEDVVVCRVPVSPVGTNDDYLPQSTTSQQQSITNGVQELSIPSQSVYTPGEEFRVPKSITFVVPEDVEYMCRYSGNTGNGNVFWVSFHPKTEFTTPDGTILPPGVEFKTEPLSFSHFLWGFECFTNYDVPTCPGCSGARVPSNAIIFQGFLHFRHGACHSGACPDGTNRCSIPWL